MAETPISVVRIPADRVRTLLARHARFAAGIVRMLGRRFAHMAVMYAMAFEPVDARIAAVLVQLTEAFGTTIPLTRREVAQLAGTTVETAIRVTTRWQREGLVRLGRGRIVVLNIASLSHRLKAA